MKKAPPDRDVDEMLPEYDFRRGIRGKYSGDFRAGSRVVILDPDVAREFPTSASVNEALRGLVEHR